MAHPPLRLSALPLPGEAVSDAFRATLVPVERDVTEGNWAVSHSLLSLRGWMPPRPPRRPRPRQRRAPEPPRAASRRWSRHRRRAGCDGRRPRRTRNASRRLRSRSHVQQLLRSVRAGRRERPRQREPGTRREQPHRVVAAPPVGRTSARHGHERGDGRGRHRGGERRRESPRGIRATVTFEGEHHRRTTPSYSSPDQTRRPWAISRDVTSGTRARAHAGQSDRSSAPHPAQDAGRRTASASGTKGCMHKACGFRYVAYSRYLSRREQATRRGAGSLRMSPSSSGRSRTSRCEVPGTMQSWRAGDAVGDERGVVDASPCRGRRR